MSMQHWDVKQAFVNAPIEEVVYVQQIKGFERENTQGKVLKLKKALYGTKQAAHAWQKYLSGILVKMGGRRNLKDECVYVFREGEGVCIIGTHVDDLFPLCNKTGVVIREKILKELRSHVEIDDRGEIEYALDTRVECDREKGEIRISQEKYIRSVIKEFNQETSNGKETPAPTTDLSEEDVPTTSEEIRVASELPIRNAIGKLWWAAGISRPDIVCALHKCASWQNKPSKRLWKHILWIIQYLKHTIDYAIVYERNTEDPDYLAYCDASFASEVGSKSRYGYLYKFLGCLVSWTSVHTTRVLTSSTEAECHSIVHTAKENQWIRDFIRELRIDSSNEPTVIYQDNMGAIALMKGGGNHKRSKHFTIEFDALREYVREKEIDIKYIETERMPADMLTKSLGKTSFQNHRDTIMKSSGQRPNTHKNEHGCGVERGSKDINRKE